MWTKTGARKDPDVPGLTGCEQGVTTNWYGEDPVGQVLEAQIKHSASNGEFWLLADIQGGMQIR